ncbi:MAG: HAMP domain-containing sensor histidine kinase [Candidatus Dormiibacterota bacterium]
MTQPAAGPPQRPFDQVTITDGADPFFSAAARMAAQIVAIPGAAPRRASFLRLEGDLLVVVAEYDESGDVLRGRYRLADFPNIEHAVESGEVEVVRFDDRAALSPPAAAVVEQYGFTSAALIPVRSARAVVGVIAVAARDQLGFSASQLEQLATVAQLVGLGVSHVASDQALGEDAERSQGLERMKGEFLNIAAHELRSPLGIVNGYVSMLLDGSLSEPDRHTALERIAEKTDEMGRLITEMLETARMESAGVQLTLTEFDLLDVVGETMRAFEPLLGAGHRFTTRGRCDALPVLADRARIATMLLNLIDNAIKYSPDGGDIEIGWSRRSGVGYLSVTDHGVGISREQQSMLFTRFGRLVTPETSNIRGTGLGLYLAREIARLHGGDIRVASNRGRGTTFTVSLPVQPTGP